MNIGSKYNYYDILEVNASAPQHSVTTAYERAKTTYSGDNPAIYTIFSENEARELLSLIEEAYSVLSNKALRSIYDQRLLSGQFSLEDLSYSSIVSASKQFHPEPKAEEKKSAEYKKNDAFENEILTQAVWDGAFIRKVREYKNISARQMSDITKINIYYVNALEKMDAGGLPAPVFVRGYAMQVAKVLGADEKKVADSYMKVFKEKNPAR